MKFIFFLFYLSLVKWSFGDILELLGESQKGIDSIRIENEIDKGDDLVEKETVYFYKNKKDQICGERLQSVSKDNLILYRTREFYKGGKAEFYVDGDVIDNPYYSIRDHNIYKAISDHCMPLAMPFNYFSTSTETEFKEIDSFEVEGDYYSILECSFDENDFTELRNNYKELDSGEQRTIQNFFVFLEPDITDKYISFDDNWKLDFNQKKFDETMKLLSPIKVLLYINKKTLSLRRIHVSAKNKKTIYDYYPKVVKVNKGNLSEKENLEKEKFSKKEADFLRDYCGDIRTSLFSGALLKKD